MNDYPNAVKERLLSLIGKMSISPEPYVRNPGKDFTRNRKLPFEMVVLLLIAMGGNTLYKELLDSQGYDINTATTSAFIQQREKILPCAFEHLLHGFTQPFSDIRKYRGYRLLAADGSALNIATTPDDPDTYFQNHPDEKGYNRLHLNALYDLCNRLYVDAIVQPGKQTNECKALAQMVDRILVEDQVILITDRGYESYNVFAHIEQTGWKYLIRVKDVDSNGILSRLDLPSDGEFDICVHKILTRQQTKVVKAHPERYRRLSKKSSFDFLNQQSNMFYPMSFRVVRLKIAGNSYETLLTNLDSSEFPPEELKILYGMRWGIETSFRELKYTIGLTNFHSKKREYLVQEVFARIIMYNFAEMITTHVVISQPNAKHIYQVNFTIAIHVCRYFLRLWSNAKPPDVEALIQKNILPVRPNRKSERKTRPKSGVSFPYRVA
jgi:hypothetical protein